MNPLTFLLLLLSTAAAAASASPTTTKYKTYLKTACAAATYPKVCYSSLSPYASKIKTDDAKLLASAIAVSLDSARSTASLVARLLKSRRLGAADAAALRDCVEEVADTVEELRLSSKALSGIRKRRRVAGGGASDEEEKLQVANMRTWLSAAITDETTCTDGFEEGTAVSAAVKEKIGKSVKKVGRLTSNALALVDKL